MGNSAFTANILVIPYPLIWFSWCARSTWGGCESLPGPACHSGNRSRWATAVVQTGNKRDRWITYTIYSSVLANLHRDFQRSVLITSSFDEKSSSLQHVVAFRPHLPSHPSYFYSHLLASIHLFAVPVTVTRVWIHADQRATRVRLVSWRNCQGGESCRWGCTKPLIRTFISNACRGIAGHTQLPVMELRTSLEKEASTELPWRVTEVTPPPTLRSSREPCIIRDNITDD